MKEQVKRIIEGHKLIQGFSPDRDLLVGVIEKMQAEIEELGKDAARLDYVIDNQTYVEYERGNFWLEYADGTVQSTAHKSARGAIDTAMKG